MGVLQLLGRKHCKFGEVGNYSTKPYGFRVLLIHTHFPSSGSNYGQTETVLSPV
jgi:hypothetical protein